MQYLTLPCNNAGVMVGFKNKLYQNHWGFSHWGCDYYDSELALYAMGNGVVKMTGYDNVFGNIIIIEYDDVYNHTENKVQNVVCRQYHMASPAIVKAGEKVYRGQRIGTMGTTGQYSSGVHVHIEFDTDTKLYNYGGPLKSDSNLIKKGYDNTLVNPSDLLYCGSWQTIKNQGLSGWTAPDDYNLPVYEEQEDYKTKYEILSLQYEQLVAEKNAINAKYDIANAENEDYKKAINDINKIVDGVI